MATTRTPAPDTDTDTDPGPAPDPSLGATTDLDITGMTCASCANRIERKLNKIDGVTATVNYATEKASVQHPPALAVEDLLRTVEQAGYAATPRVEEVAGGPKDVAADLRAEDLRRRFLVAAGLTVPVTVLAMAPGVDVPGEGWWQLLLTTPVVLWAGLPFHRATVVNARHGASTMDTLVSLGTIAAYLWSVVALLAGGHAHYYFETAAVVTTFLLAGRYAEARAKRRAGAALRALLDLGAKDVAVLEDGVERRVPVDRLRPGTRFVVRPGEKVATDGVVESGRFDPGPLDADRGVDAGRRGRGRRGRRSDRQRWGSARGARHRGRVRHPAGPDLATRRAGPVGQGRGAATGRPGLVGVRAGGAGHRDGHAGGLAAERAAGGAGLLRGGRRPHHRLPVRAGLWPRRPRCWSAVVAAPSSAS